MELKTLTYIQSNNSVDSIIKRHYSDVKRWKANITDEQKQLPYLYWTPKMHKHPSKQRFIAGSSSCSTKSTSAMITLCVKLLQKAHKIYCDRIKSDTGFNFMWILQNSIELQDTLQKNGRNLTTYDFPLYTLPSLIVN